MYEHDPSVVLNKPPSAKLYINCKKIYSTLLVNVPLLIIVLSLWFNMLEQTVF